MRIGDQKFPNLRRKPSGFYWEGPPAARSAGFGTIPLGKELDGAALERYARAQQALGQWRARVRSSDTVDLPEARTVDRLLWDYFNHRRFLELPKKTADDYRNKLRTMANFRLLNGERFGALPWVEIEANHTDKLYELMCYGKDGGTRESYARAVMHTARIVWNWAERYYRKEFQWNPFKDMRLPSADARTVKWEPEQVWKFCKVAEDLGRLSVALVAVFCYELGQRVGDARGMCRSMFESEGIICIEQGKTSKRLVLPVSEVLKRYVAKAPAGRDELVINENTGRPYTDYEFSHAAAEVREAAGLPSHLWVADLRRTCINELAVLGASDDQLISVSGHTKRQTLSVYSLMEYRKALDIMQRRWAERNQTNAA